MTLKVSPAALQDLKDIQQYISQSLNNPIAAKRTVQKIIKTYLQLSDSPFIGTSLNTKISIVTPYRYLVSGNYLIFYVVKDNTVEINRVIYGKRDYIKILFPTEYIEFNDSSEDASE